MSEKVLASDMDFLAATRADGLDALVGGIDLFELTESSQLQQEDKIEKIKTCCRACIANCGVIATVKNGRVVKLEGNPDDKMSKGCMCAKGLSGIQALYHPNRNKYPMMRVGKRGDNKWRRISWEKAIDIIAKKLVDTKEKYGAEAVVGSTGGGGNPAIWSVARFCNIFGSPNWFEPGCAQCYLPRRMTYSMMYGGSDCSIADNNAQEIYRTDETPMKTLVLWGTDPSYSCPSCGGRALVALREKGVNTVVIDPRLTPDAARATVWLPIRPGTDVALAMCWIRYIIDKKLYNLDFTMKWTNLPYLVNTETKMQWRHEESNTPGVPDTFMVFDEKTGIAQPLSYPWNDDLEPALEGTFVIDGTIYKTGFTLLKEQVEEYTLAYTAELCELDPAKIEEAVLLYAENTPSGISIGVATDQGINSVQAPMGTATLDMLMGNVECPGSVLHRFKNSGVSPCPISPSHSKISPEQLAKRLGGVEHKGLHSWGASHITSVFDAILTGEPYKPRVWLDRSGNKMAALADAHKVRRVVDEMDFIVHMYMYPTSFSAYADILLPVTEWLESSMAEHSCNTIQPRQQVAHLWETMNETEIWAKIAKRCAELGDEDCKKAFDAEYMGKDLPYWDNVTDLWDMALSPLNITYKELTEMGSYEYATWDEWATYYVYLNKDEATGLPQGFNTPSKKCEVYLERLITMGRTGAPFINADAVQFAPASQDYSPLPYYLEPNESPRGDKELVEEFPLVMTSGRIPFFHHNTLRNVPWLREMYPVPEIWIYPTDAEKYGLADGDWAWVASKRGKIRGIISITEGIKPGVVYMERFWNPETLHTATHGWQETNINVLTSAEGPFNPEVGTYTLRGFLVSVTRAEGPPEGIWTKPKDFASWLAKPTDSTKEVKL